MAELHTVHYGYSDGGQVGVRGLRHTHVSEKLEGNISGLSIEEYKTLRQLLEKYEASFGAALSTVKTSSCSERYIDSSLFAQSGTASYVDHAFSCLDKTCNSWIMDSGASSHMTGTSTSFRSYFPCSGRDKVRIADGSLTSVSAIRV